MTEQEHRNQEYQDQEYFKLINKIAANLQYGSITIHIQDGKIVQIEKQEKFRMKSK